MRIKFLRNVSTRVYNAEVDEEISWQHTFRRNEILDIGEVSLVQEEGISILEFTQLGGFAEVPSDSYAEDNTVFLRLRLFDDTHNN